MNFDHLTTTIASIQRGAQSRAGLAVNQILNHRNWLIGAYIIEFEQGGEDRAAYGERLVKELAKELKARGSAGLSASNLKNFRQVAYSWPTLPIRQTLSGVFPAEIRQTPSGFLVEGKGQALSALSARPEEGILSFPSLQSRKPALDWQDGARTAKLFSSLSFSHLLELARIDDPL